MSANIICEAHEDLYPRAADTPDDNLRIMLCPCCGSEGFLIYARGNDPDHERYEECPACEGACVVLEEVEPITLDDFEEAFGP